MMDCNKVYFSDEIRFYQCWRDLKPLLERWNIPYGWIRNTRDLWVRDFMPIQVRQDRFVQFVYRPSYLKGLERYRSDPKVCIRDLNFPLMECNLLLDGGNLIWCDNCAIVSDRVFAENDDMHATEVINQLERALETEVVIIPSDPNEMTGHADGMVRYLGEDRVLLNHYVDFDRALRYQLLKCLSSRFEVIELHLNTSRYLNWSWAYLNYLQIGAHVFVPCFESQLDETAYRQLECVLGKNVHPIRCKSTVKIGGGLNCLSWTVMQ